jgi:hypothetical protein
MTKNGCSQSHTNTDFTKLISTNVNNKDTYIHLQKPTTTHTSCNIIISMTAFQYNGSACILPINMSAGKGKGNVHPRTGHEGPEGEKRYSSTLSLTLGVGGQLQASVAVPTGKRPGTHFIGGRVNPRVGMEGCGKSHPHRHSIPGSSSP